MPAFDQLINNFTVGDDLDVLVIVVNPPVNLNKAYFTVKASVDDADPGLFQVTITTSAAAEGQITNGVNYTITASQAGAEGDTELNVKPLPVPLEKGTKLTFGAVQVTLTADAAQDARLLAVRPLGGAVAQNTTASVSTSECLFSLTAAQTVLMTGETDYSFDAEVFTTSGKQYTPVSGTMQGHKQVTRATS